MESPYSFCKKSKFSLVTLIFLTSVSVFAASKADPSPVEFKKDKITLAGKIINIELALTENERNHFAPQVFTGDFLN